MLVGVAVCVVVQQFSSLHYGKPFVADAHGGIRFASFVSVHNSSHHALCADSYAVLCRIFRCKSWVLLFRLLFAISLMVLKGDLARFVL